jgi:hypothetical protein
LTFHIVDSAPAAEIMQVKFDWHERK